MGDRKPIELPFLSEEEVKGCEQRAGGKLEGRLFLGFCAELACAKYAESVGVKGAYLSCVIQQSRGKGRVGGDSLEVDVKTSDCRYIDQALNYNLQVSSSALGKNGAERYAFAPFVHKLGRHVLLGWAFKDEVEGGESIFYGDKEVKQLPVSKLRPPETLFA